MSLHLVFYSQSGPWKHMMGVGHLWLKWHLWERCYGAKQTAWCCKTGQLLISADLLHSFKSGSEITSSH